MSTCAEKSDDFGEERALHRLGSRLCERRNAFEQRLSCLNKLIANQKVS